MTLPSPEKIESAIEAFNNLIYINRHEHPPVTKHLKTALQVLSALKSGELVEPASEADDKNDLAYYKMKAQEWCDRIRELEALTGKVGELVGKEEAVDTYDRLRELYNTTYKKLMDSENQLQEKSDDLTASYMCGFEKGKDSVKYMSVEEVEQVIASNMPIEFIQVIKPFKRADIYKQLAQALTRVITKKEVAKLFLSKRDIIEIMDKAIQPRLESKGSVKDFIYPTHSFKAIVAEQIMEQIAKPELTRERLLVIIKNAMFRRKGGENMAEKIADAILATRLPKGVSNRYKEALEVISESCHRHSRCCIGESNALNKIFSIAKTALEGGE